MQNIYHIAHLDENDNRHFFNFHFVYLYTNMHSFFFLNPNLRLESLPAKYMSYRDDLILKIKTRTFSENHSVCN